MQTQTVYKKGHKDGAIAVIDPHEEVRVYRSEDYDRFSFAPENRPIYQSHLLKIKESLRDNGFLKERPIDVVRRGDSLVITDGQHRFMACRELGLPVYYVVKSDSAEEAAKAIRVINAYSRSWKPEDYMRHFVALENPAYLKLAKFMTDHDIGLSAAMGLLASGGMSLFGPADIKHLFRTGALSFGEDALDKATSIMGPVNEIRNMHERLMSIRRDPAFIKALIIMTSSRLYEHDRFLKNLATNIVSCVYTTSVGKYLQMLESIYNYKRKDGTRVYLSRKGMTLVNTDQDAL